MIEENSRLRNQEIVSLEELSVPITLIGAGSIGSFSALALTKIGVSDLTVVDYDDIEVHNVGCQLYGGADIGKKKVIALTDILKQISGVEIKSHAVKWSGEYISSIVISGVDSMDSRRSIWEVLKSSSDIDWYIDARMGGEYMNVYTVKMDDKEERDRYEKTLAPKETEAESCSARSIAYNTLIIGGIVAHQVKRIVKKESYSKEIIIDLPSLQIISSPGVQITQSATMNI